MGAQARGSAVAVALLVALLVSGSHATQYTVGDANDWNLQVDYTTWAAKYKFKVGDTLLFKYSAEEHNVMQVSAADYQSCNLGNAVKTWADGNTVVSMPAASTYYFVCGTPSHCTSGMKVAVSVLASTAAPPPSSATPPAVPPPVATPPAVPPPVTPPPVATPPPVSPPPAPLSSPPSSSAPAPVPPPSPTTASSPTPSPGTLTPTPSSSPAPSSTATPASSLSPSATPLSSPPSPLISSTQPATAPSSSNAYTSLTAQAVTTITAAAFVGTLLL